MIPIAADGWPYLWKLAGATLALYLVGWEALAWIAAGLTVFTAFFFRDPDREVPPDRSLVVSPADGRVLRVEHLEHEEFLGGPAVRISIFLSLFNVHVNRSPITGTVRCQRYRAGKMLPAFKPHASELNERNTIGIEGEHIRAVVHQITGLLARRIVCRAGPGTRLARGQRFGMIKFGSCTELLLPEGVEVLVREGERVRGGASAVARIRREA
ncbi:MAG: phosphatidylserine decarboxylase [Deferrisomatales bacterium]